jgi:hypothetical protein
LYSSEKNDILEEHIASIFRGRLILAGFFLDLPFDPEDGGDMFLRNFGNFSNYTVLQHRRANSSYPSIFLHKFIVHNHPSILQETRDTGATLHAKQAMPVGWKLTESVMKGEPVITSVFCVL